MSEGRGRVYRPWVTVCIPVLNEEEHIATCLEAVDHQAYENILEILVIDGGSTDRTCEMASCVPLVRVLQNPKRTRPAGLNLALAAAKGEVLVRVDARTLIEPDYVQRCVSALERSGAAIVGGPMRLRAATAAERAIKVAMTSTLGAGGAQFRREGGGARFVDTVYLGAYRLKTIKELGGYDEWFGGNEDAELAFRAKQGGGVFLDPAIRSTYAVRKGLGQLWRQYYRYGTKRARTMMKHPRSISARQLAIPCLLFGLATPMRRRLVGVYGAAVVGRATLEATRDGSAAPWLIAVLPVMHGAWGTGFVRAVITEPWRRRRRLRVPGGTSGGPPLTSSRKTRT